MNVLSELTRYMTGSHNNSDVSIVKERSQTPQSIQNTGKRSRAPTPQPGGRQPITDRFNAIAVPNRLPQRVQAGSWSGESYPEAGSVDYEAGSDESDRERKRMKQEYGDSIDSEEGGSSSSYAFNFPPFNQPEQSEFAEIDASPSHIVSASVDQPSNTSEDEHERHRWDGGGHWDEHAPQQWDIDGDELNLDCLLGESGEAHTSHRPHRCQNPPRERSPILNRMPGEQRQRLERTASPASVIDLTEDSPVVPARNTTDLHTPHPTRQREPINLDTPIDLNAPLPVRRQEPILLDTPLDDSRQQTHHAPRRQSTTSVITLNDSIPIPARPVPRVVSSASAPAAASSSSTSELHDNVSTWLRNVIDISDDEVPLVGSSSSFVRARRRYPTHRRLPPSPRRQPAVVDLTQDDDDDVVAVSGQAAGSSSTGRQYARARELFDMLDARMQPSGRWAGNERGRNRNGGGVDDVYMGPSSLGGSGSLGGWPFEGETHARTGSAPSGSSSGL
ncbi:hypothetical protein HK097_010847 [Rhizophlyctis rosea]|uniref:Uncharacterized protein n=1 Tax=Rhizophlyctis rosea TaxID=64517 RepID=A0AAD5SEZ9_9FUNG|nr:hypothetical protein HK097_010847 [Rhizophlyctis rosea]